MPKNKVSEWSTTASNNTDIGGINVAEGCAPSGINNAIRELMAQVKDMQTGADGDNFVVGGNLIVSGTASGVTPSPGDSTTKFATTAFVQAALAAVYPVGSIYVNATNSTNPATLLGFGTWTAFGAGRVMVGLDATNSAFDTAEETGGSANAIVVSHTHTGTTSTTGSHTHYFVQGGPYLSEQDNPENPANYLVGSNASSSNMSATATLASQQYFTTTGDHSHTFTTNASGSSGTNANLQPYITVYMWKRTA